MICYVSIQKIRFSPPGTPPKKTARSFPASRARIRMSEACRGPRAGGSRGSESLGEAMGGAAMNDGDMGVSENSVPLNPMVNDHYPY